MFGEFRLRATREGLLQQTISLYGFEKVDDGANVAQPLTMNWVSSKELEGVSMLPMCRLDPTAAQSLMDELWECGLRPSEGTGSAGALAATQKHLEDMRKLVFIAVEKNLS